ncbi:hypothetical protein HpMS107_07910 [Helicobacter pylori]|uniref:hypothetical protein n=1 Tax=Cupriavidus TaxID=106589 RepID=UPI000A852BF0|nr:MULTISPECIES: hypothetical protein [Cupriavidus]
MNAFTQAPAENSIDSDQSGNSADSGCQGGCRSDIVPQVYRFQFVMLAFDRPQTVRHLPQWRWPLLGPYNGYCGAARIRGWQLLRFYQANGWLTYIDVCSVTGTAGRTQLHNEDYARPWDAYPVSKRAHALIHTRARCPNAWADFLRDEALPNTWATTLSQERDGASRACSIADLLEHSPHPDWVVVPEQEFESR